MQTNKRYWLKFGIICAIFNIILSLILISIPGVLHPHDNSDLIGLFFPNVIIGQIFGLCITTAILYPLYLVGINLYPLTHLPIIYGLLINFSIYWFIMGALIGWLYGKIKNRSRV